jgi:hypothetical protein
MSSNYITQQINVPIELANIIFENEQTEPRASSTCKHGGQSPSTSPERETVLGSYRGLRPLAVSPCRHPTPHAVVDKGSIDKCVPSPRSI